MSNESDFVSTGIAVNNMKKHSELDLVPTRITPMEPDPLLFVTPEKKGLLKNFQKGDSLVNEKSPMIPSDPDLFVTPEKFTSVLKNVPKVSETGPTKNKVRFNIPESNEDTTSSLSPNTQSTYTESSSLSTEFDEGSSQTTEDASDFATKAALYTQRNPLADITFETHGNFDSTTSSDTFNSANNSSQQSFRKLFDMKGQKLTKKQSGGTVVEPSQSNDITKITTSKNKSGHRKNTPTQQKIDKLTSGQGNIAAEKQNLDDGNREKSTYLRKKSGLHKHQHSVRYLNKEKGDLPSNTLEIPKYSSSIVTGQKLQQIKEEKFDALKTVKKKMQTDSNVKDFIETKAATGTNVDPEEQLYSNLIGVEVAMQEVTTAPEFRRVKRAPFVKHPSVEEPDIMQVFPSDLIQEKVVLDSRCFTLHEVTLHQAPRNSVMSLYEHSLSWC